MLDTAGYLPLNLTWIKPKSCKLTDSSGSYFRRAFCSLEGGAERAP
ncbi:MAG: hypothetical protein ABUK13_01485 [Gammaproteobacteria bacterium]